MNGSIKSLARLGGSPSRGSPTSYHIRNSSSASSLSLAPEFITSTAHKDMTFVPCAASARYAVAAGIHHHFWQNMMTAVFQCLCSLQPQPTQKPDMV